MKMKSIIYSVAAASIAMMGFDAMACTNLLALYKKSCGIA